MLHVDNSGKGNCMYYAYSISLMYFLRAKNAPATTNDIFNKLKLNEEDKAILLVLLAKDPKQEFTIDEFKTIIEPILGRATRKLAAEYTKEEFKKSPYDTALFSAAKYGLEYYFKKSFESNGWQLEKLIKHEFTDPDYTEAEIYKVIGINTAMQKFVSERLLTVLKEFKYQWEIKEEELQNQEQQLTPKEIRSQKRIVLDHILKNETVHFFSTNDYDQLNQYVNHLQEDSTWGSEETLFTLHRAIQGERLIRNVNGTIDMFYDCEIVLHLYRNGSSPFVQPGSPKMILNNQDNVHWTSTIPDSVFELSQVCGQISKTAYPEDLALYIRENKQSGPKVSKLLRQLHQFGLEGNKKYTAEYCREIAQHYLNYVKDNSRHFDVTDIKSFVDEMDKIITATNISISSPVASSVTLAADKIHFAPQLTVIDEFMKEVLPEVKKEVLHFTHEEVKKQYSDALFTWAKDQDSDDLAFYIMEIIDKKYAPTLSTFSFRQRAEPVKEYLRTSAHEDGANRLAYILSSGYKEDGALNKLIIEGLTPLMLESYPITSIDNAIKDKSFEKGLADFTKDVVFFAKKDKRFTHPFSENKISLLYLTIYDWVDTLTKKSFESLIESSLKKYERFTWGSRLWGASRRMEVASYLPENSNAKVLAMIFINGHESSTLNEFLFAKIIETIKKEVCKYPLMLQKQGYSLISQFNLEEHKEFYLTNLKYHLETVTASQREQLPLASGLSC